jgi:hypothetical protein
MFLGSVAFGRGRLHDPHDVGRIGCIEHERPAEDGDVVREDGGDLVRVTGASDVAQQ